LTDRRSKVPRSFRSSCWASSNRRETALLAMMLASYHATLLGSRKPRETVPPAPSAVVGGLSTVTRRFAASRFACVCRRRERTHPCRRAEHGPETRTVSIGVKHTGELRDGTPLDRTARRRHERRPVRRNGCGPERRLVPGSGEPLRRARDKR
jgi:hypothetical protein